jgi:hypothetical protein
MAEKINIKKFNPATIKPGAVILIIGKRRTGKSFLELDLLYHLRDKFDIAIAMAGTLDTAEVLRKIFPSSLVFENGFDVKVLQAVIRSAQQLEKNGKQRSILLLADDCSFGNMYKGTDMRFLHMNGRHLGITFMNSMQYLLDAKVDVRNQIDYLFVFKEQSLINRQKLHKYYFGVFSRFEDFEEVMKCCTSDYQCLVYDGTSTSTELQDSIFWYKACPTPETFTFGKKIFYKLDKYYGKKEDATKASGRDEEADEEYSVTKRGTQRVIAKIKNET